MNPRERDFKILASLWGEDNYFLVNKKIMRKLGASKTIILSLFFDMWRYCKGEEFFYLNRDLQALTHHDERTIRKEVRELIEAGYIIKTRFAKFDGSPKQYFVLDTEKIIELLVSEEEDSLNPTKMQVSNPTKMQGSYYNNNYRDNNNRDINTDSSAHASDALVAPANAEGRVCESKSPIFNSEAKVEKEFVEFWEKYPKGTKKQEAFLAYMRALSAKPARGKNIPKGVKPTHEMIMQGLERWLSKWKQEGTEERFIPDASNWLDNLRYLDELEAPSRPKPGMPDYGYVQEDRILLSEWVKKYNWNGMGERGND